MPDGKNIRRLNLKSLRLKIGLVQQEPALIAASIFENIAYVKELLTLLLQCAEAVSADNLEEASTTRRFEAPLLPARSSTSSGFPNGEMNARRGFDSNSGPCLDEVGADAAPRNQYAKSSGPFLPPQVASLRMNNVELGNRSWFPPGSSYPAASIRFLSERGDQPYPMVPTAADQRILESATQATFGGDLYGGPVLSSAPTMAVSPASAFPYLCSLLEIVLYGQAIDLDPNDGTLLSNRSLCWIRLGQAEQA